MVTMVTDNKYTGSCHKKMVTDNKSIGSPHNKLQNFYIFDLA